MLKQFHITPFMSKLLGLRLVYPSWWLLLGILLLIINHVSVLSGNPWLIPSFMRVN